MLLKLLQLAQSARIYLLAHESGLGYEHVGTVDVSIHDLIL